jgi:glutathione S-transferase
LIEKGAAFDIVIARARQDPEFLAASPMGKIPFLETPRGCIAETVAILEYLEEILPVPALYPRDPFLRARGRQIINVIQMYVEAQSRLLFPGVFFGSSNGDTTVAAVRHMLDRATAALRVLMQPRPFLLGAAISHADLFAFYCLDIADRVTRFVYSRSILLEIGTLTEWSQGMAARPSSRIVFADFYAAFVSYLEGHNARYDCRRDIDVLVPLAAVGA